MSAFRSFGSEEELNAFLKQQHEMQHLGMEQWGHELNDFWTGLTADQLDTITTWLHGLTVAPADVAQNQINYTLGCVMRIWYDKSGRCGGCGKPLKDHTTVESLLDDPKGEKSTEGSTEQPADTDSNKPTPYDLESMVKSIIEQHKADQEEIKNRPANYGKSGTQIAEETLAAMDEYGVEDDPERGGIRCAKCHYFSPSLEDRMMQGPKMAGCPGCRNNTMHGGTHW